MCLSSEFRDFDEKSKSRNQGYLAMYASQRMPALPMPGRKRPEAHSCASGYLLPPYCGRSKEAPDAKKHLGPLMT